MGKIVINQQKHFVVMLQNKIKTDLDPHSCFLNNNNFYNYIDIFI